MPLHSIKAHVVGFSCKVDCLCGETHGVPLVTAGGGVIGLFKPDCGNVLDLPPESFDPGCATLEEVEENLEKAYKTLDDWREIYGLKDSVDDRTARGCERMLGVYFSLKEFQC